MPLSPSSFLGALIHLLSVFIICSDNPQQTGKYFHGNAPLYRSVAGCNGSSSGSISEIPVKEK